MSMLRLLGVSLGVAIVIAAAACGDDDEGVEPNPDNEAGVDASSDTKPPPTPSDFGLDTRPSNKTCKAPARPPTTAPVKFERVFNQAVLAAPMQIAQFPGDASRWFVALRGNGGDPVGRIVYFATNAPATLKEVATVSPLGGLQSEGGLLGMAFHPKCTAASCKLYVSWTRTGGPAGLRSEVGYLTSTNNGESFTGYTPILGPFDQPYANHNGGGIVFGKDGFLYLSFGDGGSGYDPDANGQKKTGFFSKILRIDVDNVPNGQTYGIPADNPFKNGGGEPATFAYGFRNPFRFSVDRESGDVWVADVGQDKWEEIDIAKLGGNYGWPCREAAHDYPYGNGDGKPTLNATRCPSKIGLLDPIAEHEHIPLGSRSITGGVVYRGKAIPAFVGTYVYGDYERQELWSLALDPGTGEYKTSLITDTDPKKNWVAFAEDVDGEVYGVALNQGEIWKLVPSGAQPPDTFPTLLSKTGCVDAADAKKPAEGLIPYAVNAQLWSDGAEKERFIALPDGSTITVKLDGDFDLPIGSVVVKSFKIGGKYIETRLLVRHDDGGWAGYTYEWNDAQTDATLLRGSKTKMVGTQTWYYPGRGDCARCHTDAAGKTLGLELGQLNGDLVYESTNRISNQLKTLEHIGMFAVALGKPPAELALIPAVEGPAPLEQRARAYLHANCSMCHRPQGGGRGNMDLRFTQPFKDTVTCNTTAESGDLGIAGAKLIVPGDTAKSLVSVRPHSSGANRMPPLASSIVDDKGLTVVDSWIKSLAACP